MELNFDFFTQTAAKEQQYPNNEAHAEVMRMMNRGDKLSVKYGTT